ncbi:hypothetical protein ACH2FV_19795 (plasmid) [Bacillus safensis subsp. safensis]|uniref:hypothetical protein n=1 Tax=Bacillus safensis TaxID=561879 RepID=UPI0037BE8461
MTLSRYQTEIVNELLKGGVIIVDYGDASKKEAFLYTICRGELIDPTKVNINTVQVLWDKGVIERVSWMIPSKDTVFRLVKDLNAVGITVK